MKRLGSGHFIWIFTVCRSAIDFLLDSLFAKMDVFKLRDWRFHFSILRVKGLKEGISIVEIFPSSYDRCFIYCCIGMKVATVIEPQLGGMYLLTCAPSKDSNELAHPRSLIGVLLHSWRNFAPLAIQNAPSKVQIRLLDHEIFSTVILSLPLNQEGQLSVSGERMCTILVNRLEDYACPVNVWLGKLTALDMTPLGWLGRKTST